MNEYVVVRTDRMEAGTDKLPLDSPRRCRYYVRAANKNAAEETFENQWPECKGKRHSYEFVGVNENVPERIFKES